MTLLRRIFQKVRAPGLELPLRPYVELEAAVDALAGNVACEHGVWPHQGVCETCAKVFTFSGLFERDVQ